MVRPDLKLKLFFNEIIVFLSIQALGLITAWRVYQIPEIQRVEARPVSWVYFLGAFAIATLFLLILIRFFKSRVPFRGFFYFVIFIGSFLVFDIWLGDILALLAAFLTVGLVRRVRRVIVQNVAIGLAVCGASVILGLAMEVWQVIIVLAVLSVYDIIAVHFTKHMVRMFKGLAEKGIIFAAIIPRRLCDFKIEMSQIRPGPDFLLLGTGDLAFPVIFAASALSISIWSSILVILGALGSVAFIHFRYLTRAKREPIPALPPIAIGSIIGLLLSLL